MAIPIGRRGQVFIKKESSYGVDPTLAASNAMRFHEIGFGWQPYNRVNSPEKKDTPDAYERRDRKQSAALDRFLFSVRPSQALNTLPEHDPIYEAALGAVTNRTNSSTVQASPSPTVNTFTIGTGDVATAGYVVGDAVLVAVTGQTGPFVRWISAIDADQLTVEPDLPAAPSSGDAVKGCITYKLTTALAVSLYGLHNLAEAGVQDRCLEGFGIDRFRLVLDQNDEPMVTASGPAKRQITTGHGDFPSIPSSQTFVGTGAPPSGLIGECWVSNTVYKFKHAEIELVNGIKARNSEYGENTPTEIYRADDRVITVNLDSWAETQATLYDLTEAGTMPQLLIQTGRTEGNIVAAYLPRVDFAVPGQDDPRSEVSWAFAGVGTESSLDAGDALSIAMA